MALSLFDHERRIRDPETAMTSLLDLILVEAPSAGVALAEARRTLKARGEAGAAQLLTDAGRRSCAR